MPKHLIWKRLQCAHILTLIMHLHTGNVYYGAVLTFHVSIFLTKKHIKNEETTPSIRFHIYHFIGRCTAHGRITLKGNKICYMCRQESSSDGFRKIYTRKELVMMEKTISDSHTSFYIPVIQKLAFYLPHVHILCTNHCDEMLHISFKQSELFQDVLCCRDYVDVVVARFSHKIQPE